MKKDFDYQLKKLMEEEYRRGYSHGFSAGASDDTYNSHKNILLAWKNDLTIMKGAPGSNYENTEMLWCDPNSLEYKNDLIVEKYWRETEQEQFEKLKNSRKGKEGFDSEGNRI